MFLYPYKIFTISKDKRILNPDRDYMPVGIYDAKMMNYIKARELAEKNDYKVSILLGELVGDIKLICLDLDDCFNTDGTLDNETKEFLKEFDENEYEVSSSGEGLHIYVLTKLDLETFIVKEMEGCKSFECYTNKRHIVTTWFDFENTNLLVGKHDKFLQELYNKAKAIRDSKSTLVEDVKMVFQGDVVRNDEEVCARYLTGRTPVTDMYQLRGLGYKDPAIIEVIDEHPDNVDQSAHDAKLVRKLMYYCLSFDAAWDMAMKTNYYKAKDDYHKKKFNSTVYKERTRQFLARG